MMNFGKLKIHILIVAMLVSLSVLFIQLFRSGEGDAGEYKVPNMGNYYKKLDPDSQKFIRNNLFSVYYSLTICDGVSRRRPNYIEQKSQELLSGTSWSFYNDEDYWYLMTNYHVVAPIVEWYPKKQKPPEFETKRLEHNCVVFGSSQPLKKFHARTGSFQPVPGKMKLVNAPINGQWISAEITEATIIYDRFCERTDPTRTTKDSNQTELFAALNNVEGDSQRIERYQLDMAMIKIAFSDIKITVTKPDQSTETYETKKAVQPWVKQNTYNFSEHFKVPSPAGINQQNSLKLTSAANLASKTKLPTAKDPGKNQVDLPTGLDSKGGDSIYYLAGYPASAQWRPVFSDVIIHGEWTTNDSVPIFNQEEDIPSSIFNCWAFAKGVKTTKPPASADGAWTLNEGASGSPLFVLQKNNATNTYSIVNDWTPVAIFWGGFVRKNARNASFYPAFNMFRSERMSVDPGDSSYIKKYNVFRNCYEFLGIGKKTEPIPAR